MDEPAEPRWIRLAFVYQLQASAECDYTVQALIDGAPGGYEPLSSSIGNLTGDQVPFHAPWSQVQPRILSCDLGPCRPHAKTRLQRVMLLEVTGMQTGPVMRPGSGQRAAGAPDARSADACCHMQAPLRVVCTGYRSGGAYAELCAIWAAVTYPSANVRTIAFGAPQVRRIKGT